MSDNLGKPNIEVTANNVIVQGVTIPRPPAIAPSQWLEFWKQAKKD